MLKGWRHCNTVGLNARQNVGILLYFSLPWFNADSLLFACFSSCLHHAVDESESFIANDLIKTQRQTYAIRPTYPGQQLYKISILKRSHDWRWNVFFFSFLFFLYEEIVLSTFICRTRPTAMSCRKYSSLQSVQSQWCLSCIWLQASSTARTEQKLEVELISVSFSGIATVMSVNLC